MILSRLLDVFLEAYLPVVEHLSVEELPPFKFLATRQKPLPKNKIQY